MASRGKDKKEIDPEELMRRKFRAKCLFRALGRLVMANVYWLIESIDQYEGVEDVKRRVEQAVRGKTKQKQLLSVKDKALLNKPAEDRTEHEKKYLYRIIGGLKCFKRYPNHVKRKLAALTYFKYYGPYRTIVRQHQHAHALYFIVSGDVIVTQMIFDELIQEYVSVEIGTMHAGDMFGEVSLLHNIPRTATVTTSEHCEFLQLRAEDFKHVLLTSVQKQWDEVRRAMSMFTYFDSLDQVASREGCIVAKMKTFQANEIILGDGCGIPNHIYFILSGRVQMVESMQVIVTTRLGKDYYTLHDPYVSPVESEEDFEKKWFSNYPDLDKSSTTTPSGILPARATLSEGTAAHTKASGVPLNAPSGILRHPDPDVSKSGETEIRIGTNEDPEEEVSKHIVITSEDGRVASEEKAVEDKPIEDKPSEPIKTQDASAGTKRTSFTSGTLGSRASVQERHGRFSANLIEHHKSSSLQQSGSKLLILPLDDTGRPSVRYSMPVMPPEVLAGHAKLKTYFMQVIQMNPGSTFGFGENMRDRRMVALTPVSCMLMPKIWLLQRNTANIWTRIQYYLTKKIPNKQQLFEEFVKQRRWAEFRSQCVEDVVARSNAVNYTTTHDVPYSIRLEEMFDI